MLKFSNFKKESEFNKKIRKKIEEMLIELKDKQLKEKLIIEKVIDNDNYKIIAYKLNNKNVLFEVYKEKNKIEQGDISKIREFFEMKIKDKYGDSNVSERQNFEILLSDLSEVSRAIALELIYKRFKETKNKMKLKYRKVE